MNTASNYRVNHIKHNFVSMLLLATCLCLGLLTPKPGFAYFAQEQTPTTTPEATAPAQAPIESAENSTSTEANENTSNNQSTGDAPSNVTGESKPQQERNIVAPTSLIKQFESDIKASVSPDLITPLLVGTDDILAITEPDSHSLDKGVIILLPEWHQAATSPKAVNFLRSYFPTEGWTTITIQPLAKPADYPSQQQDVTKAAQENQEILAKYQEQLVPIIEQVMAKAAEFPGIFVVVAEGNNAALLLDSYQQSSLTKPNALVMLSAHLQSKIGNNTLARNIASSDLPILDLWLKKDNAWVAHFAQTRKAQAEKEMKTYFRQRMLVNFTSSYYPEEKLAKEIKGWLSTIGW